MKINLLILLFSCTIVQNLYSGPLRYVPQTLIQPNGDTVHCYASGDEYYHWLHDTLGYTITLNLKTKFWLYADKKGDELVPTDYIVGKCNPVKTKL